MHSVTDRLCCVPTSCVPACTVCLVWFYCVYVYNVLLLMFGLNSVLCPLYTVFLPPTHTTPCIQCSYPPHTLPPVYRFPTPHTHYPLYRVFLPPTHTTPCIQCSYPPHTLPPVYSVPTPHTHYPLYRVFLHPTHTTPCIECSYPPHTLPPV